jgi:hypothetical protein
MSEDIANPAATADAEQRARQEIAGARARLIGLARVSAGPLAAAAALVSCWVVLRKRRKR